MQLGGGTVRDWRNFNSVTAGNCSSNTVGEWVEGAGWRKYMQVTKEKYKTTQYEEEALPDSIAG